MEKLKWLAANIANPVTKRNTRIFVKDSEGSIYPYYVVYDGYITSKAKGSLGTSKPFMYRYPTAEENTVTLAEFRDAKARRARINSILPEDLILLDDEGKEIEMSKKQREDFKFTGLSTIDMIDCEWWNSETENLKIF